MKFHARLIKHVDGIDMNRFALVAIMIIGLSLQGQQKTLVWEDNFDGNTLNTEFWNYELGDGCPNLCGWGNNEVQTYARENVSVIDGYLHIRALRGEEEYTSGRITTKGNKEFKYGSIEARLKVPTTLGLWTAFWMLWNDIDAVGWPMCGEIDIMEYVGKNPNKMFATLHTQDSHGNSKNGRKELISGLEEGFHLYRVDWTENDIRFFVDNKLFYSFSPEERSNEVWPFDKPFYLIFNVAIGGNLGGDAINKRQLPDELIVDYVKVYN